MQSAIDAIFIPEPPRRSPIHTVCECFTFPVRSVIKSFQGIVRYFRRMCGAFGVRFVVLCFVASGSVGTAESIATFAGKYLYTDAPPNGLGLTAARVEVMEGLVRLPWVTKCLFGVVSDTVPIRGYHRMPYQALGSVIGAIACLSLALIPIVDAALTISSLVSITLG